MSLSLASRRRRPRPRRYCPCLEELESRLAPSVSPNVAITTDPGVQQMPSIAADPSNPQHLVTAYMDYSLLTTGYAGIGVAVSYNGGSSWQHTSISLPADFDQGAAQPTVQFDGQGHVFVSFTAVTFLGDKPPTLDPVGGPLRAMGFESNNGIFVARSDDGGLNWDTPVAVVSHLYDGTDPVYFEIKPNLAIDTFRTLPDGQPNPYYGSLYDAWSRYYPTGQFPGEPNSIGGSDIMLAVSRDEGKTWQLELQPQAGTGVPVSVVTGTAASGNDGLTETEQGVGHENYSQVTVGPEGDIYIAQGPSSEDVYHSTDGGASFSQPGDGTAAGGAFGLSVSQIPSPTLANDQFRTQVIRDIAADPTRPGTVYAVTTTAITDASGNVLDAGDVVFARSSDHGLTWTDTFEVGGQAANVLNDDNGGQSATGLPSDVVDGQAIPRLVTDSQGDIAVIWYDTRRDPAGQDLDVFGTVSTDGGKTFSPNFRITDQSFNPNAGVFTDATGNADYYLGDAIGLTITDGIAYAVWTDTRNGNQDIYSASFPINPPPPPPGLDRFAPNNTPATATALGRVVTQDVYKLATGPGDEQWFRLQAAATGSLTVSATLAVPGDSLRLELFDATGTTLLATGSAVLDSSGQVVGQTLTLPGQSGQTYLVRVLPGPAAATGAPAVFTLDVQSLTADLGPQVYGAESGNLAPGDQAYYALTAPAPGSLEVILTPGANVQGNLHLELLDPITLNVLATGQVAGTAQLANLAVTQGQTVYLHVFGDTGASGDFSVQFTNLDQFTTQDNKTLFFPTGGNPCQVAVADLTGNGKPDIVVDYADQNFISVLLNNGDGTFQAPRDYAVGVFGAGNNSALYGLPDYKREMVIADFNSDGIPDIAVLNYQSNDISLLLGRGDGTFAPQRRINAPLAPFAIAAGDLTNNGITDLVVVGSTAGPNQQGWVLLGRGDATFLPPITFVIPNDPGFPTNTIEIADVNHDGKPDLVYSGDSNYVLLGNGDGTFQSAIPIGRIGNENGGLALADFNGDGNVDIISTDPNGNPGSVGYWLNNGDGTFQQSPYFPSGEFPVAVGVADLGSQVTLPDGSTALGPPDGIPDLIVANNGLPQSASIGPPEIVILPGLLDNQGHFAGFGGPIQLTPAQAPLDLQIADVTGEGAPDVIIAENGGVLIYYGQQPSIPPNTTPQTARNLGTVVHLVEPTQTIVPSHTDSYFTLTAPTEAAQGAGAEILDFSALFQAQGGAGLAMQLLDAHGNLLADGERFRVRVPQGAVLTLHVYGVSGGTGAYTLDIDALPQLVSVQAEALLPGVGQPIASLVLTFQGDRLDPVTAQNPANYTVTWLGPDGNHVIPVQAVGQSIVYDPGANIDIATGLTYPTAVRQTVTLLFDQPLPAGSYIVALSPAIQTAPFNPDEAGLLAPAAGVTGHAVVSLNGTIVEGASPLLPGLVPAGGSAGDFSVFKAGTPFLTQLHDDLGALLDASLTVGGNAASSISADINRQIVDRFSPALGPAGVSPLAFLVIWLDPVVVSLYGPDRRNRVSADPASGSYQNTFSTTFASVAGNVELLVVPFAPVGVENYLLSVEPTPAARGGVLYFGPDGVQQTVLTADLRAGQGQYALSFGSDLATQPAALFAANAPDTRDLNSQGALSIASLDAVHAERAEQVVVTGLTPIDFGGAGGETFASAGGGGGAGNTAVVIGGGGGGPPVEGPVPVPPGLERLFGAAAGMVERIWPGAGRTVGSLLRVLWALGTAKGGQAAVERPAPLVEVVEVPAVEKVEAPAPVAEPAVGRSWSWSALLGLVGGLFFPRVFPFSGGSQTRAGLRPAAKRRGE